MDITITEFQSRTKPLGKVIHTTWEDLVERLKNPVFTDETSDEYVAMTNEERSEVKDVGGYVAGELEKGKREKKAIKSRCILTIDADDATDHDVDDFTCMEDYVFFVHTTHTSTAERPRLRWLFPLSRPVTAEEYRLLIGVAKTWVGADTIDETTDQPERLMFWPSVSFEADYNFWSGGRIVLDPDSVLDGLDPRSISPTAGKIESSESASFDVDGYLYEGQRNKGVFTFAARLRTAGLEQDEILAYIKQYNDNHCIPLLPESELRTIVQSVCKYPKGELIPFALCDSEMDFGDLGKKEKNEENDDVECCEDFKNRSLPPVRYLVEGFIPEGSGVVVADPKFGKSWFVFDLAVSLATGTNFFSFPVHQTGVLYCSLEDRENERQERLKQISEGRDNLQLLFHKGELPTLNDGLEEKLDLYLHKHPEIRVIIIDTFQIIRGDAKRGENAYAYDYREAERLHNFAKERDISIILVHHTNKTKDETSIIRNISGTNGIGGAFDYTILLSKNKHSDNRAHLQITGRRAKNEEYLMTFNGSTHRWEMLGKENEVVAEEMELEFKNNPAIKTIVWLLDEEEMRMNDNNEDGSVVEIRCRAAELMEKAKSLFGGPGAENAIALGRMLAKNSYRLKEYYEITKDKITNNGTVYTFTRDRLK